MKFLLINPPPDRGAIFSFSRHLPPMGLLYIGRILENFGHKVELLDFEAELFSEEKIKNFLSSVDIVGISVTGYCVKNASLISKIIKNFDPEISIVVGGPFCSIDPNLIFEELEVDICVDGEGEKVIDKVIKSFEGEQNLSKIPGVFFREKDKIKKGPPAELINDLDSIPFPARHLVDKYEYGYLGGIRMLKSKLTSIMTARGCPFNCRFCCVKSIAKKYRMRSTENVNKEIDEISEKYSSIYILDDNFLVDKKRAIKIMDHIIENDYDFEMWVTGVRIDSANDELFKKMKKAGVKIINFGIESGNQDVLDYYNKKITLDQIEKAVKQSRKAGFFTIGNFILGAPIETKKHFENTVKLANKLPLELVFFSNLHYYKGSDLWKCANEEGKISSKEYVIRGDKSRGLSNFTEEEVADYCIDSIKKFFFRPSYVIDQTIRAFVKKDPIFFKIAYQLATNKDIRKNMFN